MTLCTVICRSEQGFKRGQEVVLSPGMIGPADAILGAMARIKSFQKDQGFGYIEHEEHGDIMFDYVACNFEPEVGDEVIVAEIKSGYKGRIKAVAVTCPAKPPK